MAEKSMPTETLLKKLMSLPADAPVAALNLFQFNDRAQYVEGDPEYWTAAAGISGEEAHHHMLYLAGDPFVD